jgi:hypothetical protein
MNRRHFLLWSGAALTAGLSGWMITSRFRSSPVPSAGERAADVVILGGGLGGCAAALAALRADRTVLLTEETDWVGGQLTQQAVPPDEHKWIESFGCTRSYRRVRNEIREWYRKKGDLRPEFAKRPNLNPGNGWVSHLCHEPRVALAVLEAQLAPYIESGKLKLLLEHRAIRAEVEGDRVRAVTVRDLKENRDSVLLGEFFLDATEQGDLLPLTKTEFVSGTESRSETLEPQAREKADPRNIQSFTCCFVLDYRPSEDHTIDKPADYDFWVNYVPQVTPPYSGKLFTWNYPKGANKFGFDPLKYKAEGGPNLWTYRRILDKGQFVAGKYASDLSLINWPQNDYFLGNLHGDSDEDAAKHLAKAKGMSRSLIYWLQKDAPRPDGKTGWPGLRLRPDVVGTEDGMAKYPYIRESRRIKAIFTVLEQHVIKSERQKRAKKDEPARAEVFADSVGIGSYPMDLHPSTGGDNDIGGATCPFQIPLGSLIPVRVENLLPACKNLGVTHLTNGCYRLHPIEWNIGEAAGALAAFCLERKETPMAVRKNAKLLEQFQKRLMGDGVELQWPAHAV